MAKTKTAGISIDKNGQFCVDSRYRKERIFKRGFDSIKQAKEWLREAQISIDESQQQIRMPVTLDQAAARYVREKGAINSPSLQNDISMLKPVIKLVGSLTLDQITNDALKPFIQARLSQGLKKKTVNHSLALVRNICNLAANEWTFQNGLSWLEKAPRIMLLEEDDKRPPRPITWQEQERLLAALPDHLHSMVLFDLNTGLREDVVCSLKWQWELKVTLLGKQVSVFVVPRTNVKGRKSERVIVCNSIAQSILEKHRGYHPEQVFTYWRSKRGKAIAELQHHPIKFMNNTAWQNSLIRAGLEDLHVHDLRHTVGMRLRAMGVKERTQDVILWHSNKSMNSHYATAQLREIYEALESISKPGQEMEETLNLHALIRRSQIQSVA